MTRRALLAAHGIDLPDQLGAAGNAETDDVLDAAAAAWKADRAVVSTLRGSLGGLPPVLVGSAPVTADVTPDDELRSRVRELRAAGRSPKQIARALGVRPAVVGPLVRELAKEQDAARPPDEVLGCWVNPGWSGALTVEGHEDWPDVPVGDDGPEGVASVLVARRHESRQVSVCGYLVDVYCLGVKNAHGPQIMKDRDLPDFVSHFFAVFEDVGPPLSVPLELARHLVYGATDYARSLGFEPARDFAAAAGHLGQWEGTSAITFGRDGVPYYVAGPHDNFPRVLRTLNTTVGEGNFKFVPPLRNAEV